MTIDPTRTGEAPASACFDACWTLLIDEDRTTGWLDSQGEPELVLPLGSAALDGERGIGAVVTLVNQIHDLLAAGKTARAAVTLAPAGTCPRRPSRGGRRRTADQVRRSTTRLLERRNVETQQLARALIADTILDATGAAAARLHSCHSRTRIGRRRLGSVPGLRAVSRIQLTTGVVAMMLFASSLVAATDAMLTDEAAMAAVSSVGGTLDIKVDSNTTNGQDGPGANWGTFSASVDDLKPSDTRWADITLRNPGSLEATVTVSATGSDQHADFPGSECFGFYLRERLGGADVQSIGNAIELGTGDADAQVVDFDGPKGPALLYTDGAARTDDTWSVAESHVYRLTVRMYDGCQQGGDGTDGASGTISIRFDAIQT